MAASDYVPIFFKNRLHLAGRPQMSTRPNSDSIPTGISTPYCNSQLPGSSFAKPSMTLCTEDSSGEFSLMGKALE
jgi:hypothetical protein